MSLIQSAKFFADKNLNTFSGEKTEKSPIDVTPEMRKGWEAYRKYLEDIGMYGDKKLNTKLGIELFDKWSKNNPQYNLNLNNLPELGKELQSERERYLEAAKKDKSIETYIDDKKVPATEYNKSVNPNLKTANPWHPGVQFTSQGFMEQEIGIKNPEGKEVEIIKLGQINPQAGILTPGMKQKAKEEYLKKLKKL